MKSKSSFLSKFFSFVLILIIIGGVGFIGYNFIQGNGGMKMPSITMKDSNTSNSTSSESKSQDSMNMNNSNGSSTSNKKYDKDVINNILQNKEKVDKVATALDDSLKLLTVDPYGVETNQKSNTGANNGETQANNNQKDTNGTNAGNGTTVNVYTQNGTSTSTAMQNMGTTYDATKMENLHTGLYKVSVGMQLLDELKNNLSTQLEQASMEVIDPTQYYYNQYLFTIQNKTKLLEATRYINEASSLVNINPYVSQNGAVYDKDRMTQIHDSIYKLAQVSVDLNKISDSFSQQSITLNNMTQNAQSMGNMSMGNTNFLGNINIATIFSILVVIFILIFVISIVGYISKMLKSSKQTN